MLVKGDQARVVGARLLTAVLCPAAALVVLAALQHAWTASNDFQWSGARLLLEGRDPYRVLFDGGGSAFAMTQFPNYAPLLYVMLLPVALLSLSAAQPVWAFLDLGMLVGATLMVAEGVGLRGWRATWLVALAFVGEPFFVTLASGQTTVLALFAAVLAMRSVNDVFSGAGLGVMLVKYSFAPVMLVAFARRRWKAVGVALAVEGVGLLGFCLITGSSLPGTTFAPLRAAEMTQARGSGDVLTLTRLLSGNETLAYVAAVVVGAMLAWYARRVLGGPHWVDALAAGALVSFLAFPHLVYDYCFLLPVAGSAVRRQGPSRVVLMAVVATLWYGWLVGHRVLTPYLLPSVVTTFVLLLTALVALVRTVEDAVVATDDVQARSEILRSAAL